VRTRMWIIGASAAAVIAGVSAAAAVSAGPANTPGGALPVEKTIELANHPGEEFAPPPANAAPKLTVQQALDAYTGSSNFQVPDGVSVALGLLTRPIGRTAARAVRMAIPSSMASPTTCISDSPTASCATFAQPGQRCRTGSASNSCSLMRTPARTSDKSARRPTGPTAHQPADRTSPSQRATRADPHGRLTAGTRLTTWHARLRAGFGTKQPDNGSLGLALQRRVGCASTARSAGSREELAGQRHGHRD
jgi:hypothetical protein